MEVAANSGNSTTLDSVLTLIDTVSNRLELVSFDYRGWDHLTLDLKILRQLLQRAGYLSSSLQSSLLFPFSEQLRHFYFLLRCERKLIYVMVEEIVKFRESVKGFQQRFCEWNTTVLDEILDQLRPLVPGNPGAHRDDLIKLKVELKLMKMFYLSAINWRNQASLECFLSKIRSGIYEKAGLFYYELLELENTSIIHGLAPVVISFRESLLICFRQPIRELYTRIWDPLLPSNTYPWLCSELIAFFHYLLECLGDIFSWGEACDPMIKLVIEPIMKVMRFLNNFILFATLWVEKPSMFERFFIHCQVSAIKATWLGYMCWFYRDDDIAFNELQLTCSELVENIKPLHDQVSQNYVETLMTSRQSSSSFFIRLPNMFIVVRFVDSLVDHLREFLDRNSSFMVNLEDRIWMLAEGLESLKTILKQQEKKLCDLNEDQKDVIINAVYEAAIVCFRLYMLKKEERLGEEINDRIFQFVEKVYPIKAKIARKFSTAHDFNHLPNNETVVGLDVEAEDIKHSLIRGSGELDIVAIVGMVGVGKTALAKKLYHDSAVIDHFHFRAWCHTSRARSIEHMLLEILQCIDPSTPIQYYLHCGISLPEVIHKHLEHKRYLVVLDNIWGSEAWDLLKSSFPRQVNGSRILLTMVENKPRINFASIRYLHKLNDHTSLELLKQKLAYNEQHFLPSQPLWLIAKLCRGLPLIVVTIAGILVNIDQVSWKEVAISLSSNAHCVMEEYVHNVLELGYKHLPDYLKPCLLYTAAFPEGQEISFNRLMFLWIAEGFVEKIVFKDREDIAEDYIMALIKTNFIMVAKQGSTGKVRTCRLHDSVREFCLAKSREESFLQLIGENDDLFDSDESRHLDHLFIYSQPKDFANSGLFSSRLSSSLLFHFKGSGFSGKSQLSSLLFHSKGVGRSGMSYRLSFSFRLKVLSVLDLGEINLGYAFPTEITTLVQLRYLAVLGDMVAVPDSIVNLLNLETLMLTTCYNWMDFRLPSSLWYMGKLRHLHIHGSLFDLSFVEDNLDSSGSLFDLATCSTLKLLDQNVERSMDMFPRIRKLKLFLLVSGRSAAVNFCFLHKLKSLKLILDNVQRCHIHFSFPFALKKLTLQHFSWQMISAIGGLRLLEVLKLLETSDDDVLGWNTRGEFPSLKFLKLGKSDIRWWRSAEYRHYFPRLEILVLDGCRYLQQLPSCLGMISTLKLIKVQSCSFTMKNLVLGIQEEQRRNGNEGLSILFLNHGLHEDLSEHELELGAAGDNNLNLECYSSSKEDLHDSESLDTTTMKNTSITLESWNTSQQNR